MQTTAKELLYRVETQVPRLQAMTESEVTYIPTPDRWSKKETLGHLIDSACNNHQRFIRANLEGMLSFPGYEQEGWARCQKYASAEWSLLVSLWAAYNQHLASVIAYLPVERLAAECKIGTGDTVPLSFLVEDYVRHIDHHLAQLNRPVTSGA